MLPVFAGVLMMMQVEDGFELNCGDAGSETYTNLMQSWLGITICSGILVLGRIAYKLRFLSHDAFGLKQEMWQLMAMLIVLGSGFGLLNGLLKTDDADFRWFVSTFSLYLPCVGIALVVTTWPLYLSKRTDRLLALQTKELTQVTGLTELLAIPRGYDAFLRFVVSEFASENLLYYKHVCDYSKRFGLTKAPLFALDIAVTAVTAVPKSHCDHVININLPISSALSDETNNGNNHKNKQASERTPLNGHKKYQNSLNITAASTNSTTSITATDTTNRVRVRSGLNVWKAMKEAIHIAETYIVHGSQFEINISDRVHKATLESLQQQRSRFHEWVHSGSNKDGIDPIRVAPPGFDLVAIMSRSFANAPVRSSPTFSSSLSPNTARSESSQPSVPASPQLNSSRLLRVSGEQVVTEYKTKLPAVTNIEDRIIEGLVRVFDAAAAG